MRTASASSTWLRAYVALFTLSALLAHGGCTERDLWPKEQLDLETAVNVTIMAEPWVYSREVPMLAANARDYLNVGVVETNRAGTRRYWLGVISWSTIDRSVLPDAGMTSRPARIRLQWPATSLELVPAAGGRSELGLSKPALVDPKVDFEEVWCALTTDQLALLGAGAPATVAIVDEAGQLTGYQAFRVRKAALTEFLEATGF